MGERPRMLALTIDGVTLEVAPGTTVACAALLAGSHTRWSVTGEPRAPLCGMGICMECRLTIDGVHHQQSCQILCTEGMQVTTEGGLSAP
ncbi:MAG TPA: (2Fe-2S)-binding protein [Terracidiphilus sp.]|nr:(2Fe-2S)-binding protein [Terracidiphilus sp.]